MIRKADRRGQRILVIDIRYKKPDGSKGRYRHDAQVQTMAAATAEERRLLANIVQYGDVHEPKLDASKPEAPMEEQVTRGTFGEVVEKYAATYMVTDLKVTTRRGYRKVLDGTLLPRFKDRPIGTVTGEAASQLDLELTKADLARGTRNNAQIVLRSVLRFAKERGYLSAIPSSCLA